MFFRSWPPLGVTCSICLSFISLRDDSLFSTYSLFSTAPSITAEGAEGDSAFLDTRPRPDTFMRYPAGRGMYNEHSLARNCRSTNRRYPQPATSFSLLTNLTKAFNQINEALLPYSRRPNHSARQFGRRVMGYGAALRAEGKMLG